MKMKMLELQNCITGETADGGDTEQEQTEKVNCRTAWRSVGVQVPGVRSDGAVFSQDGVPSCHELDCLTVCWAPLTRHPVNELVNTSVSWLQGSRKRGKSDASSGSGSLTQTVLGGQR